ncbi:hypothetical protein Q9L58_009896 [Maublancomyces gigas]|uniref:Uncharacterized protein n=1 Tax=Discina gigas TaxID=1032678 RepID=A0ABR3G6A6_9PEZI
MADPEAIFNSDPLKLPGLFTGLGLKFSVNASKFRNNDVNISYSRTVVKASARAWFHPQIDDDGSNSFENCAAFVLALKNHCKDSNPKATAESALESLDQANYTV